MAVKLRLARHGAKAKPFYRIVACEKESKRDGKFIEVIGTYQPQLNPPGVTLKEEKVRRWVESGAVATEKVRSLIEKQFPGLITKRIEHKRAKIQEQRRKRKARVKGTSKPGKAAKKK